MPQLSKDPIVERSVLQRLGRTRLKEAEVLREAKCYAGAIYLAGYAVECYLKVAICVALDWQELTETFASHDLELLLRHSGLDRKIRRNRRVHHSFGKIQGIWTLTRKNATRYRDPRDFKEVDADRFLEWVSHKQHGVVPWLEKRI